MHMQFLSCGGVKFKEQLLERYEDVFDSIISTITNCKEEKNKEAGLKLLREYMVELHKQVVAPITDHSKKEFMLANTTFLARITDAILPLLQDYYENVRTEAQMLLICITARFLPS